MLLVIRRWALMARWRMIVLLVLVRRGLRVADHESHAGVRALLLCMLLEEARILDFRVTVAELVLRFDICSVTLAILSIIPIFLLFDHRFNLIILKLAVARIVFSIGQGQDMTALV